jgi:chromosome segregation and condensation protein ScpB
VPGARRLSGASLEVLAIIAYRQPIGRSEVEEIRGVGSAHVLRNLQDLGLIDVVARGEGWAARSSTGPRSASWTTSASPPSRISPGPTSCPWS